MDIRNSVAPNKERDPSADSMASIPQFLDAASQGKLLYQPGDFPDCSPEDIRSLDFYVSWVAPQLTPWPTQEFWKFHVPQSACSEPSIRHALIAIANNHEELKELRDSMPMDGPMPPIKFSRRKLAVQHYQKSVFILAKVIAENGAGSEMVIPPLQTNSWFVLEEITLTPRSRLQVALVNSALFFMFDHMWGPMPPKPEKPYPRRRGR
jgi:hypothetical protein